MRDAETLQDGQVQALLHPLVPPLVSIIITTYYRPAFLREAVAAARAQTYGNIEIVLVNNGGTPETLSYLRQVEKEEPRVRLVHFETNQFDWDDPGLAIRVCFNAGLKASRGELVFHQEDDDWVAPDFIERMVALFEDNPECVTAIGRVVSALPDGTMVPYPPARRASYIPGHELALDYATGSKVIDQSNPGHCFVMRREALESNGGFHESFEIQQMFAIVPFGITGYDPDALMYWRRHDAQLNVVANGRCVDWSQYSETLIMHPGMRVLERWRSSFGGDAAATVQRYFRNKLLRERMEIAFGHFFNLRPAQGVAHLARLRKLDRGFRLSLDAVHYGFVMAGSRSRLGRVLLRCQSHLRSLFTDPLITLKKVRSRLLRKPG